ncbi:MAG: alginate export family protein, partial [Actinobacteria bacterium]|nr:alginate export family protein [Actinomycetota bacterium]
WAGNARRLIGDQTHGWGEFGVTPGLEGQISLGEAGTLRAGVSGVYTTTQLGLDAAGSNLDDRHPHEITLEDAYVGWKSGDLIPSLGEDAIDLAVGSQPYELGTGFLFYDGGTDGGRRGGYWLGLRKAFRLTAIARLKTGPFLAEGMYLRPDDRPDSSTDVAGLNLEWSFGERATIGAAYWNVYDSDDERRDGLHVFDLRFEGSPLVDRALLPGLRLSGEVAHERNGTRNDSWGAYTEVGYEFEDAPWKPYLSYRYAYFTGDDGKGSNSAFDPLFYGFYDWGTWYLGEIVGEYVASNSNARVHTLRVRAEPTDAISVNLLYFFFRLDEFPSRIVPRPPTQPRAALIRDRNLA